MCVTPFSSVCVTPLTNPPPCLSDAAITQNNGKQLVLSGGETHLLTHQKWQFEKFITLKIQTDDLERIEAASADNIIMHVNSTVVWRIKDVQLAATMGNFPFMLDNFPCVAVALILDHPHAPLSC